MLKSFNKTKKAQVSNTMTWIVATIIIIVILVFTYFLSANGLVSKISSKDREKDFVAVKSINVFVEENKDFLIQNINLENYDLLDGRVKPFLQELSISGGFGKWNFGVYSKDKNNVYLKKYGIILSDIYKDETEEVVQGERQDYFEINFFINETTKFVFWENCIGGCQ